jgi:ribose transport system substrate-binding protein
MKTFATALLFVALTAACGDGGETTKDISIAVIPKGTTHVFWQSIHAGANKAAAETGVTIYWMGPEKEDDRRQQISLVDNQVMKGVSGIVLAPLDSKALRRPVEEASRRGVPTVVIDSDLDDAEDITVGFVATDNYQGGKLAGERLAELIGGEGRVVLLRYMEGSASTEKRERGFLDAIAEYPNVEVVSEEQYGGATTSSAQQAAENLLLRFKDDEGGVAFDGVFTPNESTTYGMLQALRRVRLAGAVRFVGFDASEPLIDALRADEIDGLVTQNPFKMGYLGVKTMVAHLKGEKIERRADTGVKLATKENLESEEIQALVNPDLDKWLNVE